MSTDKVTSPASPLDRFIAVIPAGGVGTRLWPLSRAAAPKFLHDLTGSEMSSKTIPKAGPLERVGNFVVGDGVLRVIEYSDLPESLAMEKNPDGSLKYNAGSIAIHAMRVSFIERLTATGRLELLWHRAEKKVSYVDEHGNAIFEHAPLPDDGRVPLGR